MNDEQAKILAGKVIELWRSWYPDDIVREFHDWLRRSQRLDYTQTWNAMLKAAQGKQPPAMDELKRRISAAHDAGEPVRARRRNLAMPDPTRIDRWNNPDAFRKLDSAAQAALRKFKGGNYGKGLPPDQWRELTRAPAAERSTT